MTAKNGAGRECGNIAAGGSWLPPDAGPSSEELGSVRLQRDHKKIVYPESKASVIWS